MGQPDADRKRQPDPGHLDSTIGTNTVDVSILMDGITHSDHDKQTIF